MSNGEEAFLETLERAIEVAYDPMWTAASPVDNSERIAAARFCEAAGARADAWDIALALLQRSAAPVVRFFALQVLERGVRGPGGVYASLDSSRRAAVRGSLLQWLLAVGPAWEREPPWVRNRFALIFALIIKADCPELWPTAFQDLLRAMTATPALLDALFRVLDIVIDEIVAFHPDRTPAEVKHNSAIKEQMRRGGALADIAQLWEAVLRGPAPVAIQGACLACMERYIGWIDVSLVANDRIVPLLFSELGVKPLRTAACACLYELVDKGLAEASKLDLLRQLRVLEAVASVDVSDDIEFAADMAELVATVGCALLTCWQSPETHVLPDRSDAASDMMANAISIGIHFLGNPSAKVSLQAVGFIDQLIQSYKFELTNAADRPPRPKIADYMPDILTTLIRKMQYPSTFTFDPENEYEAEFIKYRAELKCSFVNIVRLAPEGTFAFIRAFFGESVPRLRGMAFEHAELVLSVVYYYGEPGDKILKAVPQVLELAAGVIMSGAGRHPHHAVLYAFFDFVQRYASVFVTSPPLLVGVVEDMLGECGLRHSTSLIRSRAAYILNRIVVKLAPNSEVMRPCAELLFKGIADFLSIPYATALELGDSGSPRKGSFGGSTVPQDSQTSLYEIAGTLLSQPWVPPTMRDSMLEQLVGPLVAGLRQGLSAAAALPESARVEAEGIAEWVMRVLAALGYLFKGFSGGPAAPAVAGLFEKVMEQTLRALSLQGGHAGIRAQIIFLLRGAVCMLDAGAVSNILVATLPALLAARDADVVTVLNHAFMRHKASILGFAGRTFGTVVGRLQALLPPPGAHASSDTAKERLGIVRIYFTYLSCLLSNDCGLALLADGGAHFSGTLSSLVEGIYDRTPSVQRVVIQVITRVVEVFVPVGSPGDSAAVSMAAAALGVEDSARAKAAETVVAVLFESIAPAIFRCVMTPEFDFEDAECVAVVGELVKLQCSALSRFPGSPPLNFGNHLAANVLPSLGVDPAVASQYVEALKRDAKRGREWFRVSDSVAFHRPVDHINPRKLH